MPKGVLFGVSELSPRFSRLLYRDGVRRPHNRSHRKLDEFFPPPGGSCPISYGHKPDLKRKPEDVSFVPIADMGACHLFSARCGWVSLLLPFAFGGSVSDTLGPIFLTDGIGSGSLRL